MPAAIESDKINNYNLPDYNLLAEKAKSIREHLLSLPPSNDISLLSGSAGTIVTLAKCVNYVNTEEKEQLLDKIDELINSGIKEINSGNNTFRFSGGLLGFSYALNYLRSTEILDLDDGGLLENVEKAVLNHTINRLEQPEKINLDYLHGFSGTAFYLLKFGNCHDLWLPQFISRLEQQAQHINKNQLAFEFTNPLSQETSLNLSTSHGNAAILAILTLIEEKGWGSPLSRNIATQISNFFIQTKNSLPFQKCFFPDKVFLGTENDNQSTSRLAWCYGDLTIIYQLLKYARVFENKILYRQLIKILSITSLRKLEDKSSGVVDAGICHGACGVAQAYRQIYTLVKEDFILNEYHYWLNCSYSNFSSHSDGIAGFKSVHNSKYVNDPGLLTGTAGILAVYSDAIHSAESKEKTNWDDFLLF